MMSYWHHHCYESPLLFLIQYYPLVGMHYLTLERYMLQPEETTTVEAYLFIYQCNRIIYIVLH